MPASTLVLIIVRLFAISWFVQAIILSLDIVTGNFITFRPSTLEILLGIGSAVSALVFCLLAWILAPKIGRKITRGYDAPISISEPSLEKLYAFAFVFLGLYFILDSIGATLNGLHYFLTMPSLKNANRSVFIQTQSLYQFTKPLITLIAGFIVLLSAKYWAARLMKSQQKSEQSEIR